jgi:hypothetical protein
MLRFLFSNPTPNLNLLFPCLQFFAPFKHVSYFSYVVLCQHCVQLYTEDKPSQEIERKSKTYDKADQDLTISAVRTFAVSCSVRGDVIET